ncbi:Lrp/AsnC family transcriptional regulator [Aquimarina sp. 2201CG5-10]|uniref:Lrp/AsnC family transcriptional regulator n=1 Tax=Aquimarina callyspongiae TaxID=3098150 RepID=UPI002AB41B7C|nr:Lrp/AsnC family transcriptional regulator [Aquimarina sp. 2201CG5-10]MDY8135882.1 Lrp/AsnC family transcriptional regulator [Aquimarina sp. 2201CG5-10]
MVDDLDRKIIDILKKNSRESYVEIGKQVGLSPSSVRERIQKLEDYGVITGYAVQLDHKKLGFGIEVLIMLKLFSGNLKIFCDELGKFPEITEAHRITGSHNISMKVILKDQLHLQEFIDKLLRYGDPSTYLILSTL